MVSPTSKVTSPSRIQKPSSSMVDVQRRLASGLRDLHDRQLAAGTGLHLQDAFDAKVTP
jgi:hypothetical protein